MMTFKVNGAFLHWFEADRKTSDGEVIRETRFSMNKSCNHILQK